MDIILDPTLTSLSHHPSITPLLIKYSIKSFSDNRDNGKKAVAGDDFLAALTMRETNQIILWIRKIEQRMVLLTLHIIIIRKRS